jgi:hypothetical protein
VSDKHIVVIIELLIPIILLESNEYQLKLVTKLDVVLDKSFLNIFEFFTFKINLF